VFVSFLCLYLLTASRSVPFGDSIPMWQAAENLARHGSFAVDLRWPVNAPVGRGGHYYPVAALLACLVHLPGALLQRGLAAVAPARARDFVVVTSQLGPIALGALVPALFFRLLGQLGYDRRQAAWTTLLLGAGTSIWVYARCPYSEILQAACFGAFLGNLLGAGERPTRGAFLRWGLSAALLVNAKNVYFACLPGAVLYVAWRLRSRRRDLLAGLGWAGIGLLPGLLALGAYNYLRWGSPTSSGYGAVTAGFWRESVLFGLWGQLLSPGKSVFLYSPPLLLGLWGMRRLASRRPHVALAIGLSVIPIVLLYARYIFWSGDWGWGPRYLVFALPALLLPAAELFDRARRPPRATRACVYALLVAGVAVQGLGVAFGWEDFINIAREAQRAWLGPADTRGTAMAPYPCFSCFEEVYGVEWLPPMQPIAGHWWLLRHKLAGNDWKAAARDAPWSRYTSLSLDIERSYQSAAIDWWPLAASRGRPAPVAVVSMLFLLLAMPLRPWLRALRADDEPAEPRGATLSPPRSSG
jgi:hypothetical protein